LNMSPALAIPEHECAPKNRSGDFLDFFYLSAGMPAGERNA